MMLYRVMTIVLLLVLVSLVGGGDAVADGEVFERQSLRGTQFVNCDLREATFTGCNLSGIRLLDIPRSAGISLRSSHLEALTTDYSRMTGLRINRTTIEGLEGYDFTLDDWDVRQSRWTKLSLRHCALRYINLERAEVRDLRVEQSSFRGARWTGSDLRDNSFDNCDLSSGSFYRGSVAGTRFQNVNFRDVRLEGCDIRGLVINGVRIDELIN